MLLILFICLCCAQWTDACVYGDGPGCIFPCRCESVKDGCNRITGKCNQEGCDQSNIENAVESIDIGWRGYGCRIGNVAYKKIASQSGTHANHVANRSVDGDANPSLNANHCAHPQSGPNEVAWLMVDLGKIHKLKEIIIYNRNAEKERATKFYIHVGSSLNRSEHQNCTYHGDEVKDVIHLNCSEGADVGRYVSMERARGSHEQNYTTICEFVVIGYEIIECTEDCNGECDDLPGCSNCKVGKQLPDCKRDCAAATWGINCNKSCGKCAKGDACDIETGVCNNGCQLWYVSDKCDVYIDLPTLANKNVQVTAVSPSQLDVVWPEGSQVKYNYYNVAYAKESSPKIYQNTTSTTGQVSLTGLDYNTVYEIIVAPYRRLKGSEELGKASRPVSEKTRCRAPTIPLLTVNSTEDSWNIYYTTSNQLDSGCDEIDSYRLYVKSGNGDTTVHDVPLNNHVGHLTLLFSEYEDGSDVWLELINNKMIKSKSKIKELQDDNGAPYSSIVWTVIGCILFALLLCAVGFLLRGYVTSKLRPKKSGTANLDEMLNSRPASNLEMTEGPYNGNLNPEALTLPTASIQPHTANVQSPTCIFVSRLHDFITQKQREVNGFKHEYNKIKVGAVHPVTRASEGKVISKNRFKNIKAYDKFRVVLDVEDDDPSSDYINASFIPGYDGNRIHYIAGQGPLSHTLSDHWRMIWQYNISRIVMVTRETELGKDKCTCYWPTNMGETILYGGLKVTLIDLEEYADFTVRKMKCIKLGKTKTVVQFHFTSWPDKQALDTALPLLQFRHKVNSYPNKGPLLVHCSAGIGRTGTYIAIDYLIEQGLAEDKIDVHQCVTNMREYRMNMVQTLRQYEFIFEALLEAFTFGDTSIPCGELYSKANTMGREITKQYQDLVRWTNAIEDGNGQLEGHRAENAEKNRDRDIVPGDSCRAYLKTPWKGCNDYINAVFVDSYHRPKAFVVTQMPLENTHIDFWRLVYDHNCGVIVSLGSVENTKGEQSANALYENVNTWNCSRYLPRVKGGAQTFGPFNVTVMTESMENELTRKNMIVLKGRNDEDLSTTYIDLPDWERASLPQIDGFVELLKQLEELKNENTGPVLVMCHNGVDKSGLLVAALYMAEYMKQEQEVDVVTAIRCVRKNRKQFVTSQKQYEYLYRVAQSYNKLFSTYANIV